MPAEQVWQRIEPLVIRGEGSNYRDLGIFFQSKPLIRSSHRMKSQKMTPLLNKNRIPRRDPVIDFSSAFHRKSGRSWISHQVFA